MTSYAVTGTLTPDATGIYEEAGIYNGQPYYRRGTDEWYLWPVVQFGNVFERVISDVLGPGGTAKWAKTGSVVVGDYPAGAGATGIATVAEYSPPGQESSISIRVAHVLICGQCGARIARNYVFCEESDAAK